MSRPVKPQRLCWTCSARIVPCGCHGHGGPMWKHQGTGHHRGGPDGTGHLASPSAPVCGCDGPPHPQWCEMYGRAVST